MCVWDGLPNEIKLLLSVKIPTQNKACINDFKKWKKVNPSQLLIE